MSKCLMALLVCSMAISAAYADTAETYTCNTLGFPSLASSPCPNDGLTQSAPTAGSAYDVHIKADGTAVQRYGQWVVSPVQHPQTGQWVVSFVGGPNINVFGSKVPSCTPSPIGSLSSMDDTEANGSVTVTAKDAAGKPVDTDFKLLCVEPN